MNSELKFGQIPLCLRFPKWCEILQPNGNSYPQVFARETFEELRKLHGDEAV